MLEIHKIKDTEIIKQLATEQHIEYNNSDLFLGAFVDGELSEYIYYKKICRISRFCAIIYLSSCI